jgi:drug/metabolite transporter (DMT)-like permease
VNWGLAGAFAASAAYGAATVLQAVGARRIHRSDRPDTRLLLQLVRSLPYLAGITLDVIGFGLSLAALRSEPLFMVQAIVSSSLAVTALLGVLVLRAHPMLVEWVALVFVTAGLALLASSARPQHSAHVPYAGRAALLVGVLGVGAVTAALAARRSGGGFGDTLALGSLAGLMFGAGGMGARMLATPHHVWSVVADPALYALAFAGTLGLLLYAMALQRGGVVAATSAVVVTETLVPAAVGITLLGDRPAHGRTALAAAGFALTVMGSLALARYGEAPLTDDGGDGDLDVARLAAGPG